MPKIRKATREDAQTLSELGRKTFIESHEKSAPAVVITNYLAEKYTVETMVTELEDAKNHNYVMEDNDVMIGFSKVIFNVACPSVKSQNLTKLDRIYLLQDYNGKGLGLELFEFNVALAKENNQVGMWLYTWTENHKAVQFYEKTGFKIVGNYLFKLDETHANLNHIMYLKF